MCAANAVPDWGELVQVQETGCLSVPDCPVIPFIEGDGVGPDIWKVSRKVFDAAVDKAYGAKRRIAWVEVYAGEKSWKMHGQNQNAWLPTETLEALKKYIVAIKGPMTTPIGGGIRSINVALRQQLDLYVCLRPVRYFRGVPSPVKKPEDVDMVIFRENTEDIYAGIEIEHSSPEAERIRAFLTEIGLLGKICFPETSSFGIKAISRDGTERLIRAAIDYTITQNHNKITIVHKGNIMKYTEGSFRNWAYALARREYGAKETKGSQELSFKNPKTHEPIILNDVIADAFLQNTLLRPKDYSVIATMNLNGDYISDALAAQVGGIGIAPGANINYHTGRAIFEATHGTAPKYAHQDRINPTSLILSGEMMFRYLGWHEAADLIIRGVERAIQSKRVTFDFARQMENAHEIKCSAFGEQIIRSM